MGDNVPGAYQPGKLHGCGFKNVALQAPTSPKLLIFGIILTTGLEVYPFKQFLQNSAWKGKSQDLLLNFTVVSCETWAYSRQNNQNLVIFGIIFSKGVYLLKRFLHNLVSGSEFQVCTLTPNFTVVALKMWTYSGSLPVPNYTFIRLTCRHCGAKNLFLDH